VLTALILLGICQILAPFGAFFVLRWYIEWKQSEIETRIETTLHQWIDQPAPDKPSKLAETLGAVGAVVGSTAAKSLMLSAQQQSSSLAQVANGIADPLAAQLNPLVALLGGGRRGKNSAVLRLAELLGPMLSGSGAPKNGNHSDKPNQGSFSL
jgi:hypothetical protein